MKDAIPQAHGGDIWAASRSTGLKPGELVDFSASINPAGMSRAAIRAVKAALGPTISAYPEPWASGLARSIAEHHGLAPENILPGNGSTELIYLLPRAFKPKKALIVEPAFSEYRRALKLAGSNVAEVVLKGPAFELDPARVASKLPGIDIGKMYKRR